MTLNLRRTIGPTDKKVFLAGEGSNELGGWYNEAKDRGDFPYPGILETLLKLINADGWVISDAKKWRKIRKFRAGEHRSAEERNVLGVCWEAIEKGCDTIAFTRDSDGHNERVVDVQKGIEFANALWSDRLVIIGGCAVPCIEGWVLAILGNRHTESLSRTRIEALIIKAGIDPKKTAPMVEKIEQTDLANIADDAHSLKSWLDTAQHVL
jgi:hypothetical protein